MTERTSEDWKREYLLSRSVNCGLIILFVSYALVMSLPDVQGIGVIALLVWFAGVGIFVFGRLKYHRTRVQTSM